jgi:methionine-gamma-lyase
MSDTHGFITNTIHAGESEEASATPIYQAAPVGGGYLRSGNPTFDAFEEKMRTLEGGAQSISTACGMAAISQTMMTLIRTGARVVCHHTVYFWTKHFFMEELPGLGVDVVMIDLRDIRQVQAALAEKTDVVYFEPLANPTLDIIDTPTIIRMAHEAGARVVVDNTYLSPYMFHPMAHGADVVLHSATKYLCGHGDALAGIITTQDESLGKDIVRTRNTYGGILSPMNAFLLLRGIKTLPMRMDRHCLNAQAVAEFLSSHPKVVRTYYPGLPFSPGYEIARAQWRGFGGMVSFETEDETAMGRFFDRIDLCKPWVSLGDVGSLVVHQGGGNRIRMSVGLEDTDDIIRDLEQALR